MTAQSTGPATAAGTTKRAFLELDDLKVSFQTEDGVVRAVDGVSFALERGRTMAIVGESGSGKSVTSQAIMGLHSRRAAKITGHAWVDGVDIVTAPDAELRALRGQRMAMIFQDPLSSLHPFYTVGKQLVEAVQAHGEVPKAEARRRAVSMLDRVGIPNAARRVDDYPHSFSGGMRQRAMIAMALINNPALLIADEPTTALDVTVQAQILELIRELQAEYNMAIVLITHDLGVVAESADDVTVMYGGRVVERGGVDEIFSRPSMPYTWGLMSSVPDMEADRGKRLEPIPGQPPSLINLPKGCVFRPRCAYAQHVPDGRCDTERPDLTPVDDGHDARCFLTLDQKRTLAVKATGTEEVA
ncbi:ABC transporter ATP-binding protein [Kineosporia sp. R_H_3]|uniref:ABC transporter ATP-binding protein n=1 Tax=Kineosporia sp. R_H_3 TaxID=1961848 RepID=UPI000B4B5B62|nr:ABC transporter ATP-binding protein [Kineosporia sp. R_H_3]